MIFWAESSRSINVDIYRFERGIHRDVNFSEKKLISPEIYTFLRLLEWVFKDPLG